MVWEPPPGGSGVCGRRGRRGVGVASWCHNHWGPATDSGGSDMEREKAMRLCDGKLGVYEHSVGNGAISQEIIDLIDAFLGDLPGTKYGPAHIVLVGHNVGRNDILWCLKQVVSGNWRCCQGVKELAATAAFLRKLLGIIEKEEHERP